MERLASGEGASPAKQFRAVLDDIMTIIEAMLESRKSDRAYIRPAGRGTGSWIFWCDQFVYELTAEDLIADDWSPASVRIGNVKWVDGLVAQAIGAGRSK